MNALIRWGKFNVVGAMGMVLQLAALSVFDRSFPGHYLAESAAAVELAILHNFVWHLRYTWRDRNDHFSPLARLLQFHFSNGLVSLVGNLVILRTLVDQARMPILIADSIAILLCSMI
ncbi:MAG: GtrA family protein, partial [Acidobacteriota bacterium]